MCNTFMCLGLPGPDSHDAVDFGGQNDFGFGGDDSFGADEVF
jgi:hypothetical protein